LLTAAAPNADPPFVSLAANRPVRIPADLIPVPISVAMSLIVFTLDKFYFSNFSPALTASTSTNGKRKSSALRQDLINLKHQVSGQAMEGSVDTTHIPGHVCRQINPHKIKISNTNEMSSFVITSVGLRSF
jgi:hypothetical protein